MAEHECVSTHIPDHNDIGVSKMAETYITHNDPKRNHEYTDEHGIHWLSKYACIKPNGVKNDRTSRKEILHFTREVCTTCGAVKFTRKYHPKTKHCKSCSANKASRAVDYAKREREASYDIGTYRTHRTRAKHFGVHYDPGVTWRSICQRDGNHCRVCGIVCAAPSDRHLPNEITLGHRKAMANGGAHISSNVQIECRGCNTKLGTKDH